MRQLANIRRDPPPLIAREQLGPRTRTFSSTYGLVCRCSAMYRMTYSTGATLFCFW